MSQQSIDHQHWPPYIFRHSFAIHLLLPQLTPAEVAGAAQIPQEPGSINQPDGGDRHFEAQRSAQSYGLFRRYHQHKHTLCDDKGRPGRHPLSGHDMPSRICPATPVALGMRKSHLAGAAQRKSRGKIVPLIRELQDVE